MKKIISIALASLMICAMFAVAVSADSYSYSAEGHWDYSFNVKKADPANVKKDGIIGDGEYEKLNLVTDPESEDCMFTVAYTDSVNFDYAEEMLRTVEYYFSWDETNGFNFAVKFKPHELKQELSEGTASDKPRDCFLQNTGIQLEMYYDQIVGDDFSDMFYYAIAKRTTDGKYLAGHYNQLGINGNYIPTAEKDYVIEYDFNTGYAICEWSVPITATIGTRAVAGSSVYFSLAVTGGSKSAEEFDPNDSSKISDMYVVAFGDDCFLCKRSDETGNIEAVLTDEMLVADGVEDDTTPVADNGTGSDTTTDTTKTTTDENGNAVPVADNGNGATTTTSSTKTGDAVVVFAAVSAVSAAGAFISKKRRG